MQHKDFVHSGAAPSSIPNPPQNNVFHCVVGGFIEGQKTSTTFYYADNKPTGNATRADQLEILALLVQVNGLVTVMSQACAEGFAIHSVSVDVPTSPHLATVVQEMTIPGTIIGQHLPAQIAVTITKLTQFRGKNGRGRISLPAVPVAWVTKSLITFRDNFDLLATKMTAPMQGAATPYRPGLFADVKFYAEGPPTPQTWVDLTGCVARDIVGTARKRKIGVGS